MARSQGFTVHTVLVEEFAPQQQYDVVVLSNVLEHSLDPRNMLDHIFRLLKPGGEVWISCPNGRSFLRSLFGRRWINWHVPFHIVQFSADSLQRLLQTSGFRCADIRHETPALWVAHSLIAACYACPGKPTRQLRNPLLVAGLILCIRGLLFPLLWLGNRTGRGDCLLATGIKN